MTTTIDDSLIIQEVNCIHNSIVTRLTSDVCDTKEKEFKDGLIKIGWTPPKDDVLISEEMELPSMELTSGK